MWPTKLRRAAALCVVAAALAGCQHNPYAARLDQVDEKTPQTAAAIQVSEPQIYARETMLNDRRRESDYLERIIKESETATFEPQVKRVIQSFQALQASANASYAPSAAASRAEDLARQQQLIDLTQKQAEYARAQADLLKARQERDAAQAAASTPPPAPSSGTTPPAAPATDLTALNAQVKTLQDTVATQAADIDALKKKLAAQAPDDLKGRLPNADPISPSSITASPMDQFRDRQAYRDELRAEQAKVQLDDGHDLSAHALYRLQFHTTVVPGEKKNKFAVVRMRVTPRRLDQEEISSLYRLWLGHVAYRSNGLTGPSAASHDAIDPTYVAMAATSDLYRFVELSKHRARTRSSSDRSSDDWTFNAALPPSLSEPARVLLAGGRVRPNLLRLQSQLAGRAQRLRAADGATTCVLSADDYEQIAAIDYIAESIRTMGNWQLLWDSERDDLEGILALISEAKAKVDISPAVSERTRKCIHQLFPDDFVPRAFSEFVNKSSESWTAAYATSPTELSQQVSSAAAAMESLQLSLSLSANMPLKGITGDGSLNYLKAAQGRVEALERLPLAVGFSEREPCATGGEPCAVFGWIFGPRAVLDPQKNAIRLSQSVHEYSGTADLSVPSWWPTVTLSLQTSWVGNWYGGRIVEDDTTPPRTIITRLRPNRADLDGLTEALSAQTLGGALANTLISEVEPRHILLCDTRISLLAFGSNVWRGTEAYLDGVRADEVRTAPDMAGLSLTFDASRISDADGRTTKYLVIWTRNGPAEYPVQIVPRSKCAAGGAAKAADLATPVPRLVGDSNKLDIISATPFASAPASLWVSTKGAPIRSIAVTPTEAGDGHTTTLTFSDKIGAIAPVKGWADGSPFLAKVKFADPINGEGELRPLPPMIYYKTPPALAPDPSSKNLANLNTPITVIFPTNAALAFVDFDPSKLTATAGDGTTFKLKATFLQKTAKGYQYRLGLVDATQAAAFAASDQNISLSTDSSDPISCTNCIVAKKAPAAPAAATTK